MGCTSSARARRARGCTICCCRSFALPRDAAPGRRRLAAARAGRRSRPWRVRSARRRSGRALDRGAACGAGGRRAVAQLRRHGRASGGVGLASGCRRSGAGTGLGRSRAVLDWIERAIGPGGDGKRRRRDRRPACRARRAFRRARALRRADARPAGGAADRAQFLFDRHPRRADASGLAARLEIGGARCVERHAQDHGDFRGAHGACRPGAPPTCGPAATTSPRRWR